MGHSDQLKDIRAKSRYILELRYQPITQILDQRGKILEKANGLFAKKAKQWRVDHAVINLSDDFEQNTKLISIGHMRSSISYEDPDSLTEFVDDAKNLLKILKELYPAGTSSIERIGFRSISLIRKPKYNSYSEIYKLLLGKFAAPKLPTSLEFTDFNFTFAHDSCRVMIGPFKEKEAWVLSQFTHPDIKVPKFGIGLDIDSYATDISCKDSPSLINAFDLILDLSQKLEIEIICGLD